jgi:integrase/recombinase XerD
MATSTTAVLVRYEDPFDVVARRISTLGSFYKYCHVEAILERNPAANVRRPKVDYESRTLGLDRNELGGLLVQAGLGSARDHALITLLAMNGLRIAEALGADIDSLDMDRGHRTLRIVRKGGKHVTIPLAPRAGRALDLYIDQRISGPIFLGANGARMDRYAADRTVKRLARRAGISKRISPHSLRHSFITAALDAGVPLRDVQEAASHADPRTTMRYDRAVSHLIGTPLTSSPRSSLEHRARRDGKSGRYRAPEIARQHRLRAEQKGRVSERSVRLGRRVSLGCVGQRRNASA